MSLWGKIIGGAAGLAVGGPIGGLIGLALGAAVDAGVERAVPAGSVRGQETRQVAFTIGVIALAAKMAKADGQVTREEVDAFKQVFRVPAGEMRNVGRIFDLARQDIAGFEAYARQLARLMKSNRAVLDDVLEALFFIALADGEIHPAERVFLSKVSEIFGYNDVEFSRLAARHNAADPDDPYLVLGVGPDASDADVKRAYHSVVRATHPDRLIAEGVPPEMIAVATRRAASVNAAYDRIMIQRKKHAGVSKETN